MSKRGLRLTPTGERLLHHAERILAQNDEIWGLMMSPGFEGQVRLGVPHDIIASFMPPILRSFAKAWPAVEVVLVSGISTELLDSLDSGEIDLTLTTEASSGVGEELLLADRLVWAGAENGNAHERNPLPVALGDDHCAFRAAASRELISAERDWRPFPSNDMQTLYAMVEADLAVAPLLSQTVGSNLKILDSESALPTLPTFYVNLYRAPANASAASLELARHIKQTFAARYPNAA